MEEVRSVDRCCAGHPDCTWETVRSVQRQDRLPRTRRTRWSRCRRCSGLVEVQPDPRDPLVAPGAPSRRPSPAPATSYGSAETEHELRDQRGARAGSDRDAHSRGEEAPRSRARGGDPGRSRAGRELGQRPVAVSRSWSRSRRPRRRYRCEGSAPSPGPGTCRRRRSGGPRGSGDQVGPPQF